jgi:hypothetical protein
MASKGKIKGSKYENDLKKRWIEKGLFPDVLTSRVEAKRRDNMGIDFVNTGPFAIQAKAVESLGCRHQILKDMSEEFGIRVIAHKRNRKGSVAILTLEDFEKMAMLLKENNLWDKL